MRGAGYISIGALLLAACASPEARRVRGGGPGADIGNRGATVVFHHGAKPFHDTRCVTKPVKCAGPLPVFSKTFKP